MGCLPLHFLSACTPGSSKIKIMTVEGRCLKFEGPIIVKEVLMDYPHHTLFHSETVRKLGNRAKPLQGTLPLQPGHLYLLVPQPSRSQSALAASSQLTSLPESDLAPKQASTRKRKVTFKCTTPGLASSTEISQSAGSMESSHSAGSASEASTESSASMESLTSAALWRKSSVELLPSPSDGVVRLKMVVSKRQLASVLKEGGDCVSMVEGLLSPLLREAEASRSDARSLSWRPSLESIPESLCPLQRALMDAK